MTKEALAQPEQDADRFCDANCTWSDHHPNCKYGKPEQDVNVCARCGGIVFDPVVAQPEQEPVAWMNEEMDCIFFDTERPEPFAFDFWKPLYTTPPQRTWVGLTDDEKETLSYQADGNTWTAVELAEAKLKEKNNG